MMKFIGPFVIFLFYYATGLSQVNINAGLVAHYPFNSNSNDATGNGHNGTLVNGPALTVDRFGNPNAAYHFDGIDDYIRVLDNGAFSTPLISIAFWYKTESSSLQNLIAKRKYINDGTPAGGAQYQFFINHSSLGKIASNLVGNTSSCTNIVSSSYINTQDLVCSDKWHFVVITFDGTTHKMFINGNLRTSGIAPFTGMLNCPSEIRFGNWWQDDLITFKGTLDDIRWYNRPLNKDEIDFLYNNFQPPGNDWLRTTTFPSGATAGDIDIAGNQLTVEAVFNRTQALNSGLYYGALVSKNSSATSANYQLFPNGCAISTDVSGFKEAIQPCVAELNQIYHVAMVYDGALLRFYRNGFLLSSTPCSGNLITNDFLTTIAQQAAGSNSDGQFLGYINEVRIWNVARTQAQIRSYMNTTLPSPSTQTGLQGYYVFNSLQNQQGNTSFNASLFNSAAINTVNQDCFYNADSCFVPTCTVKSDFTYQRSPCSPFGLSFQTNSTGYNSINWDLGDGNTANATSTPTHNYQGSGNYPVSMILLYNNCADTVKKIIPVDLLTDNIVLTPDTTICYPATKKIRTAPALNFCWSPINYLNDPGLPEPATSTPSDITYFFTAQVHGTNLLNNGNFTGGNMGFSSDYTHTLINSNPGQYYIGSNPQTWNNTFNGCTDHSSGTGNMMVVHSSTAIDTKIWSQTVNVTPNTNYLFSTWTQPVTNASTSGLMLNINNKDLGNLVSNTSPACTWSQSYITWNSGSTTSATLSIVNKSISPQDNIIAIDDIVFAPVFMKRDSVKIQVDTALVRTILDTSICAGSSVPLTTTGNGSYLWTPANGLNNPGIGSPVASPLVTTEYIVTTTLPSGCAAKDTVVVTVTPRPVVSITNDTTICKNASLQLFASGGSGYLWSPSASLNNAAIANPVASPDDTTMYYVVVSNGTSCTTLDSVKVGVRPTPVFFVTSPTEICKKDTLQLLASGGDLYDWQPSVSLNNTAIPDPLATPQVTTTYNVTITETACSNSATLSTLITVNDLPSINASKSNDIDCSNDFSQLSATGGATYVWQPAATLDNPFISSPIARPMSTTNYTVEGKDLKGCKNYDTIQVKVDATNKGGYLVANAFTPNNDGLNDCFGLKFWGAIIELDFSIYNRWGQRIFHTTQPSKCWNGIYNGIPQDAGVYIYVIRAKTSCESSVFRKGTFALIR